MVPNSIFSQIFINYFPFCKEQRAGLSFALLREMCFLEKLKNFLFLALWHCSFEKAYKVRTCLHCIILPTQFRQAKFCYWWHYAILQRRISLHLSKPEQNQTQSLIFNAISKANWCMEEKTQLPTQYDFGYQSKNVKRNQNKYCCCHRNTWIVKK